MTACARLLHLNASSSHRAIMEMEIDFFHRNHTVQKSKLMDHIHGMASGKVPFFPTALSFIYDKLFWKVAAQPAVSGSSLGTLPEAGSQSAVEVTSSSAELLKCRKCDQGVKLQELYNGSQCPHCPPDSYYSVRSFMQCPLCNTVWGRDSDSCLKRSCEVRFM